MAIKHSIGDNPHFASIARYKSFKNIIYFVALIFILRLAQLQIIKGSEYEFSSQAQAIKKVKLEPFRGNIFDRKRQLIVHNEPAFSLSITPYEFREEAIPLLASILEIDPKEIADRLTRQKALGYSPFIPIKLYRNISFKVVSLIEEYSDYLSGVDLTIDFKRLYSFDGNMAHLLGYTGEISSRELEKSNYYSQGDIIGKSGLEKSYEDFLRGREGIEYVAVNKFGKKVASFDKGQRDLSSNNGFDLHLSLDLDLQIKAEKMLEGKRGSVVAIDPNNGEILVFACKPDYDPRRFSGKIPASYYDSLNKDESKPLLDRSISAAYPPGSAWKMIMATAALTEGVLKENTILTCGGGYAYGGRFNKCMHNHGSITVKQAIQESCNSFFYQVSLKLGLEKVVKWGQLFGFGTKTGFDLPESEERPGNFPSVEKLLKNYKGWIPKGILLNYGIGQGEILVTPIQMANYAAMLANGGIAYRPHVVKKVYNNIEQKYQPINIKPRNLNLDPEVMDIVRQGMYMAVNVPGGTGYNSARIDGLNVCGKTSTAQNPHGKDHGWFICFAPKENPKIAIAVIVENMGMGGVVAAPIAKEILKGFFYPDSLKKHLNEPLKIVVKDTISDLPR